MSRFTLDPRLEADTRPVCDLALSHVVAMRAVDHPWVILVPRRPDLVEILDLDAADRATLFDEITTVAEALRAETGAHKLNVAALGNVVAQLHVHVIARFRDDPAWPDPVWGRPAQRPLGTAALDGLVTRLAARLAAPTAGA
jgi:diadenosine tetraphosphate (Ap4A) HIT family hydrolase